jgi:hypothetical protein
VAGKTWPVLAKYGDGGRSQHIFSPKETEQYKISVLKTRLKIGSFRDDFYENL